MISLIIHKKSGFMILESTAARGSDGSILGAGFCGSILGAEFGGTYFLVLFGKSYFYFASEI